MASEQCQQFLIKWSCALLSWNELIHHRRHGLGYEKIPKRLIKPAIPEHLDLETYLAFRHQGNLPFVGFRTGDVFHVLWVERRYNDLYNH